MTILSQGRRLGAVCLSLAAVGLPLAAHADAVGDFYSGKTIKLIISTGAGGGQDQTARIIARTWSTHIPGKPTFVPMNMPGGGSVLASNYVYNVGAKDGTVVGSIIPSIVMHQVLGRKGVKYDASRFQWIGSSTTSNSVLFVWHTTGVTDLKQAMTKSLILGATGSGSNSVRYPAVLNNIIGTRFKVIMGYRSTNQVDLAMERGEVQGRAGGTFNTIKAVYGEWLKDKKINILVQIGPEKEPGYESVPLLTEFAKDDESRAVLQIFCDDIALGRPFLVAPGVPADRVAALRTAFMETMKDPKLLADTAKLKLEISPTTGDKIAARVNNMINANKTVLARVKAALDPKGAIAGKVKGGKGKKKKGKKKKDGGN